MANHRYDLEGISGSVELGKGGSRIKSDGGILQARNNADTDLVRLQAATPTAEDDVVTKKYLETRANVIVTGQIDGGSPPAAGTQGRVFVCTTTGGAYTEKNLYYDNGTSWEEIVPQEGLVIKVTDDLTGGNIEFDADHLYMWDADGSTWVDLGPAPSVTKVVRGEWISIDYTDTGANLIDTVPANSMAVVTKVNVTQVWDSASPVGEIGDATDPNRLAEDKDINLKKVGVYETGPCHLYGSSTAINFTLTDAGSPTQGQALVYIEYALA